jgi:multimeric flavodoxin WrbA
VYEEIKDADSIIFGSPIYFHQITGQARIWLDGMVPMVADFKPRYPGKK